MKNTKIEWTATIDGSGKLIPGHTFNPWYGCAKKIVEIDGQKTIDPACLNCYAEDLMDRRYGQVKWGPGQPRKRTNEAYWKQPLKWDKEAAEQGVRRKVFCASLADWLDDDNVPIQWLADLLLLIDRTPNLDWMMLSKRVELWADRMHKVVVETHDGADTIASAWLDGYPPKNVWAGATATSPATMAQRVPILVDIPARIRFLSIEPITEPIKLSAILEDWLFEELERHIHLAILGGESGNSARECHISDLRSIAMQFKKLGIRVFVKQLGSKPMQASFKLGDSKITSVPFHISDKKGGIVHEFPPDLQLRELV